MKRSEKLLLLMLAVVCAVAGYMTLFEPEKTTNTVRKAEAEFSAFVSQLKAKMSAVEPDEATRHALALLDSGVGVNPFYTAEKPFYFETDGLAETEQADYVYSGYLRFGDRAMAIINNLEYAVGEELAEGGFRVVSIARESVTLEREDPNTGRVTKRQIPIVEDDMEQITLRRTN